MRILKRPLFLDDLFSVARTIATEQPGAALRFVDAVEHLAVLVSNFPRMGGLCQFDIPETANVRAITIEGFSSWILYYRQLDNAIELLRILHGARDQQTALEQKKSD